MKSRLLILPLAVLAFSCHRESEDDVQPDPPQVLLPVAAFDFPATVEQYGVMSLQNKSQNATAYRWDFGDGARSTLQTPTHSYAKAGAYIIKLKVQGAGPADSTTHNVTVGPYSIFNHEGAAFARTYACKVVYINAPTNGPVTKTRLPDQEITFTQQGADALLWQSKVLPFAPDNAAAPQLPPVQPYYTFFLQGTYTPNGYLSAMFYKTGDSVRFVRQDYIGHNSTQTTYHGVRRP